jgi:hypothetical protein
MFVNRGHYILFNEDKLWRSTALMNQKQNKEKRKIKELAQLCIISYTIKKLDLPICVIAQSHCSKRNSYF